MTTWHVTVYDGMSGQALRGVLTAYPTERRLQFVDDADPEAVARTFEAADVELEMALGSTGRVIRCADGSRIEFAPGDDLAELERVLGAPANAWLVRLERSLPYALASAGLLVLLIVLGFRFGVPLAAHDIASRMNDETRAAIGRQALKGIDQFWMDPSTLATTEKRRLRDVFEGQVVALGDDAPPYQLLFRSSRMGPNAFALPGDTIVLTDELVELLDGDEPVVAVLLHELGHVRHRHALRAGLQRLALSLFATFVLGDVIDVVAIGGSLPALLVESGFSRTFEREADGYALVASQATGLGADALLRAFETMIEEFGDVDLGWLSTHPALSERIERIRAFLGRDHEIGT